MVGRAIDLLIACGWLLVPLIIVAAFIISTTIERWFALAKQPLDPLPVVQKLHQAHSEGGVPALLAEAEALGDSVAAISRAAADATPGDPRPVAAALASSDAKMEAPLLWLRVVSDLAPLVACLFSIYDLTKVNRLITLNARTEVQELYAQALTLTAVGLALALLGRLAVLVLERRRVRAYSALQRIGDEIGDLLGGPRATP